MTNEPDFNKLLKQCPRPTTLGTVVRITIGWVIVIGLLCTMGAIATASPD